MAPTAQTSRRRGQSLGVPHPGGVREACGSKHPLVLPLPHRSCACEGRCDLKAQQGLSCVTSPLSELEKGINPSSSSRPCEVALAVPGHRGGPALPSRSRLTTQRCVALSPRDVILQPLSSPRPRPTPPSPCTCPRLSCHPAARLCHPLGWEVLDRMPRQAAQPRACSSSSNSPSPCSVTPPAYWSLGFCHPCPCGHEFAPAHGSARSLHWPQLAAEWHWVTVGGCLPYVWLCTDTQTHRHTCTGGGGIRLILHLVNRSFWWLEEIG